MTLQGDPIHTTVAIKDRECFWSSDGRPGGPTLSFPAGTKMKAGTNPLGGNIFGAFTDADGHGVLVPLGETEWAP